MASKNTGYKGLMADPMKLKMRGNTVARKKIMASNLQHVNTVKVKGHTLYLELSQ